MNKTVVVYAILLLIIVLRIIHYCSGNFESCTQKATQDNTITIFSKIVNFEVFNTIRQKSVYIVEKALYSPHSELALGMIIGIDNLQKLPKFSTILRDTGTIHVVVVSGYNINLVFGMIIKIIGSPYKLRNTILACFVTLSYCFLSGFEPPVFRAWIMGFIIIFTKYYGTKADSFFILLLAAIIILIINPSYLFSLSFQLSFLATFSLIYFSDYVKKLFERFIKCKSQILEDLYSSIAVQIVLWPYISYHFATFNILSPIINALILWTVPITTVAGGLFLLLGFINQDIAVVLFRLLYIPLDIFVDVIEYFSKISTVIHVKLPLALLLIYYLLIFSKNIKSVFKK